MRSKGLLDEFYSCFLGSPKHVMLCACEAQDGDMQGRGRAHSQSAMSKTDDAADRHPPQAGASITYLGLPFLASPKYYMRPNQCI